MLEPLSEHQLLLFWLQILLLYTTARTLGALMVRIRQPAVIGELGAGLVIGPSLFGRLAPDAAAWLFPGGPDQSALLLGVAWIGALLLLVVIGFETDLRLLRKLGRPAALVSVGSLVLPLGTGVALGWAVPADFLGPETGRATFALFLAVGISISALAVGARILADMKLMRRDVGQMILGSAMANDLVGWILLGMIAGIATRGALRVGELAVTVGAMAVLLVGTLTVGQRLVDTALRRSLRGGVLAGPLTVSLVVAVGLGALTHLIGVEAVLGAFLAGIVLGRSRYQTTEVQETLEVTSNAIFAPLFFATAGLYVDVGLLASVWVWALVIVASAALAKLLGAQLGALLGGIGVRSGFAIGVGLNARGAMEIVLATVALSLGVFNQTSYTVIVLLAMATSMATPPVLRRALRDVEPLPEEAERLEREALLAGSVIARTKSALVPTRGGQNSVVAALLVDLCLQPDARVTVLSVRPPDEEQEPSDGVLRVMSALSGRTAELRTVGDSSPADAILAELQLGYELVVLGLNEDFGGTHEIAPLLREVLRRSRVPMLVVRRGIDVTGPGTPRLRFQRIVVPATGTRQGRAAEELAFNIAARTGARLDVVHVMSRADKLPEPTAGGEHPHVAVRAVLASSLNLARRFGQSAAAIVRTGQFAHSELLEAANERRAGLIVLGTQLRTREDRPFLGHGIEFLLEHAPQTVAVIAFPGESAETSAD